MVKQIHKCGTCDAKFTEEQDYLDHECTTGFTPKDIEHQDVLTDGEFSKVSESALKRGEERKDEEVK